MWPIGGRPIGGQVISRPGKIVARLEEEVALYLRAARTAAAEAIEKR